MHARFDENGGVIGSPFADPLDIGAAGELCPTLRALSGELQLLSGAREPATLLSAFGELESFSEQSELWRERPTVVAADGGLV